MVRHKVLITQGLYFSSEYQQPKDVTQTRKKDRELGKCCIVTKSFSIFPHSPLSQQSIFMQGLIDGTKGKGTTQQERKTKAQAKEAKPKHNARKK